MTNTAQSQHTAHPLSHTKTVTIPHRRPAHCCTSSTTITAMSPRRARADQVSGGGPSGAAEHELAERARGCIQRQRDLPMRANRNRTRPDSEASATSAQPPSGHVPQRTPFFLRFV